MTDKIQFLDFNALTGGYDVAVKRDYQTAENSSTRTNFRFGMDGPNAESIFQAVVEGDAPDIPSFRTAKVRIAGGDLLECRERPSWCSAASF